MDDYLWNWNASDADPAERAGHAGGAGDRRRGGTAVRDDRDNRGDRKEMPRSAVLRQIRAQKRARRIRKLQRIFTTVLVLAVAATVVFVIYGMVASSLRKGQDGQTTGSPDSSSAVRAVRELEDGQMGPPVPLDIAEALDARIEQQEALTLAADPYAIMETPETALPPEDVVSQYVLLVDMEDHHVLIERGADTVISPASMTKILTLLVAAENIDNWDATVTIDREVTDYCFSNGCSVVGYELGETVNVRELLYGTILPSGADAAVALARYTAGSHEAFVDMMNAKLEELGISDTAHFTNCVGLYDPDHHCTLTDMAVILQAAMDNSICQEVLSAHTHVVKPSEMHPEGYTLSNLFLRRIEDHVADGFEVIYAKTGYVSESGCCAASYAERSDGHGYLCVTAMSTTSWRCIFDHVALYAPWMGGPLPDEDTQTEDTGAAAAAGTETATDTASADADAA